MNYRHTKKVPLSFADAIEKTKDALAKEGFGILTEIDVAATLKKKLDVEHGPYHILGACNPALAHQALQAEQEIGLFLPCNVIVYQHEGDVFVSTIRPVAAMSMIDNAALAAVAAQAEEKLLAAIEAI